MAKKTDRQVLISMLERRSVKYRELGTILVIDSEEYTNTWTQIGFNRDGAFSYIAPMRLKSVRAHKKEESK